MQENYTKEIQSFVKAVFDQQLQSQTTDSFGKSFIEGPHQMRLRKLQADLKNIPILQHNQVLQCLHNQMSTRLRLNMDKNAEQHSEEIIAKGISFVWLLQIWKKDLDSVLLKFIALIVGQLPVLSQKYCDKIIKEILYMILARLTKTYILPEIPQSDKLQLIGQWQCLLLNVKNQNENLQIRNHLKVLISSIIIYCNQQIFDAILMFYYYVAVLPEAHFPGIFLDNQDIFKIAKIWEKILKANAETNLEARSVNNNKVILYIAYSITQSKICQYQRYQAGTPEALLYTLSLLTVIYSGQPSHNIKYLRNKILHNYHQFFLASRIPVQYESGDLRVWEKIKELREHLFRILAEIYMLEGDLSVKNYLSMMISNSLTIQMFETLNQLFNHRYFYTHSLRYNNSQIINKNYQTKNEYSRVQQLLQTCKQIAFKQKNVCYLRQFKKTTYLQQDLKNIVGSQPQILIAVNIEILPALFAFKISDQIEKFMIMKLKINDINISIFIRYVAQSKSTQDKCKCPKCQINGYELILQIQTKKDIYSIIIRQNYQNSADQNILNEKIVFQFNKQAIKLFINGNKIKKDIYSKLKQYSSGPLIVQTVRIGSIDKYPTAINKITQFSIYKNTCYEQYLENYTKQSIISTEIDSLANNNSRKSSTEQPMKQQGIFSGILKLSNRVKSKVMRDENLKLSILEGMSIRQFLFNGEMFNLQNNQKNIYSNFKWYPKDTKAYNIQLKTSNYRQLLRQHKKILVNVMEIISDYVHYPQKEELALFKEYIKVIRKQANISHTCPQKINQVHLLCLFMLYQHHRLPCPSDQKMLLPKRINTLIHLIQLPKQLKPLQNYEKLCKSLKICCSYFQLTIKMAINIDNSQLWNQSYFLLTSIRDIESLISQIEDKKSQKVQKDCYYDKLAYYIVYYAVVIRQYERMWDQEDDKRSKNIKWRRLFKLSRALHEQGVRNKIRVSESLNETVDFYLNLIIKILLNSENTGKNKLCNNLQSIQALLIAIQQFLSSFVIPQLISQGSPKKKANNNKFGQNYQQIRQQYQKILQLISQIYCLLPALAFRAWSVNYGGSSQGWSQYYQFFLEMQIDQFQVYANSVPYKINSYISDDENQKEINISFQSDSISNSSVEDSFMENKYKMNKNKKPQEEVISQCMSIMGPLYLTLFQLASFYFSRFYHISKKVSNSYPIKHSLSMVYIQPPQIQYGNESINHLRYLKHILGEFSLLKPFFDWQHTCEPQCQSQNSLSNSDRIMVLMLCKSAWSCLLKQIRQGFFDSQNTTKLFHYLLQMQYPVYQQKLVQKILVTYISNPKISSLTNSLTYKKLSFSLIVRIEPQALIKILKAIQSSFQIVFKDSKYSSIQKLRTAQKLLQILRLFCRERQVLVSLGENYFQQELSPTLKNLQFPSDEKSYKTHIIQKFQQLFNIDRILNISENLLDHDSYISPDKILKILNVYKKIVSLIKIKKLLKDTFLRNSFNTNENVENIINRLINNNSETFIGFINFEQDYGQMEEYLCEVIKSIEDSKSKIAQIMGNHTNDFKKNQQYQKIFIANALQSHSSKIAGLIRFAYEMLTKIQQYESMQKSHIIQSLEIKAEKIQEKEKRTTNLKTFKHIIITPAHKIFQSLSNGKKCNHGEDIQANKILSIMNKNNMPICFEQLNNRYLQETNKVIRQYHAMAKIIDIYEQIQHARSANTSWFGDQMTYGDRYGLFELDQALNDQYLRQLLRKNYEVLTNQYWSNISILNHQKAKDVKHLSFARHLQRRLNYFIKNHFISRIQIKNQIKGKQTVMQGVLITISCNYQVQLHISEDKKIIHIIQSPIIDYQLYKKLHILPEEQRTIEDLRINPFRITFPISAIEIAYKKNYLHYFPALQLFITNGNEQKSGKNKTKKSYFIVFKTQDQFQKFIGLCKIQCQQNHKEEYNDKGEDLLYYQKKGLISNFEFLLQINNLSGRSINDPSQYYVFPWTIFSPNDNQKELRNLSEPIGKINPAKFKIFQERYKEAVKYNNIGQKPFYYGSFYSNPANVSNFMLRVKPFTSHHLHLQSNRFDVYDRLFRSFRQQCLSVYQNSGDLKELIPEFYYFPEFLRNRNLYRIKNQEQYSYYDQLVKNQNIKLPSWVVTQTPEEFVFRLRRQLQLSVMKNKNSKINGKDNLNAWIQLIFGRKSIQKNAAQYQNLYNQKLYKSFKFDYQNQQLRELCFSMRKQFGQVPYPIFRQINLDEQLEEVQIKFSMNQLGQYYHRKYYRQKFSFLNPSGIKLHQIDECLIAYNRNSIGIQSFLEDTRVSQIQITTEGLSTNISKIASISIKMGQETFLVVFVVTVKTPYIKALFLKKQSGTIFKDQDYYMLKKYQNFGSFSQISEIVTLNQNLLVADYNLIHIYQLSSSSPDIGTKQTTQFYNFILSSRDPNKKLILTKKQTLNVHSCRIEHISIKPDMNLVVSIDKESMICVFTFEDYSQIRSISAPFREILQTPYLQTINKVIINSLGIIVLLTSKNKLLICNFYGDPLSCVILKGQTIRDIQFIYPTWSSQVIFCTKDTLYEVDLFDLFKMSNETDNKDKIPMVRISQINNKFNISQSKNSSEIQIDSMLLLSNGRHWMLLVVRNDGNIDCLKFSNYEKIMNDKKIRRLMNTNSEYNNMKGK